MSSTSSRNAGNASEQRNGRSRDRLKQIDTLEPLVLMSAGTADSTDILIEDVDLLQNSEASQVGNELAALTDSVNEIRLTAVKDTTLTGTENQNANLGGLDYLPLYSAGGNERHSLLQFNVEGLDATSFNRAVLQLSQLDGAYDDGPLQISVVPVTSPWTEGSDNNPWGDASSGASWLSSGSGAWSTPGGDLDSSTDFGNGPNGVVTSVDLDGYDATNNKIDLDVTSLVQAWADGSLPNYGLALKITQGEWTEYLFASSESVDADLRPVLILDGDAPIDPPDEPGLIQIADAEVTVNEDSGPVEVTLQRTQGTDGPVTVFYETNGVDAVDGEDFTGTNSGQVEFADGQTTAVITVDIIDDTSDEADETFQINLTGIDGAILGPAQSSLITIADDDIPDPVDPSGGLKLVATADTTLTGTENRSANLGGMDTIALYTAGGNDRVGLLQFDVDGLEANSINTAVLQLSQLDGAYDDSPLQISVLPVASAWAEGNDSDPWNSSSNGATYLSSGIGNWNTPGGDLDTQTDFGNGPNGVVARVNLDGYNPEQTRINFDVTSLVQAWADGTLPNHGLALKITQGDWIEYLFASSESADENLRPTLIIDSEPTEPPEEPGFIGLGETQLTVSEDDGTVQLTLVRSEGTDGEATVFYQTLGVEAEDGSDFVGTTSGQVTLADGQSSAVIPITLIDDNILEPVETFSVSLFRSEGAQLGVPRTAVVTIVDDQAGEGLVGHWRLDETAIGQVVDDSTVNANDGVHRNINAPQGPTTDTPDVSSPNSGSLTFDGANDFVSIGPDESLDLSDGRFTQSVWIKPDIDDTAYHGVLGYQPGTGSANRYPGIWVIDDRIHAGFGDGSNWNRFTTGQVLTQNEWNHVATTFDGTTYRAFVNGVEVFATTEFAGRTPTNVSQLDIGRVDNYFEGSIDDVRIYNRVLSPSEIAVLIDDATVPAVPLTGEFVAQTLVSGFDTPVEVEWLPDGRMLVAEQSGLVQIVNTDGSVAATPLLDIENIVNAGTKDRGLIGFAVHPDFENNPYIYAAYTYDPPEVNDNTGLAGPDGNGARVSRISRFTVDESGTFADPNSNVVLVGQNSTYENIGAPNLRPGLNDPHSCVDENGNPTEACIPADEVSHTIGELEFGPDGMLYIASGDGGSFGRVDPINLRALDIDSLAGKILRVDPMTGEGLSDNPFFDGDPDSNQSKVFNYGLRNPFRFALNDDPLNPEIFIGDVGWTQWEEVNVGTGGENFGWPAFEGGDGTNQQTGGYRGIAEVQAYYATNPDVTAPAWARLHSDGGRAIVMGDFAGAAYGLFADTLILTDIGDQVLRAVTFDENGEVSDVNVASQPLGFIVDIHTGPDGLLYYVDITGSIGRLDFRPGA